LRFEFENRDGNRIGVVAGRSGDFEIVVYPRDDPDQAQEVFRLTGDEAEAPGELRAGTALIARGEFSLVIVGLVGTTVEAVEAVATP
jgi:TrkA domain protein